MEDQKSKTVEERLAAVEQMNQTLLNQLNQNTNFINAIMMALGLFFKVDPEKKIFDAALNFGAPQEQKGILTKLSEMVTKHDDILDQRRIISPQGAVVLGSQS